MKVAQYINCPPWELEENEEWFRWANLAQAAEVEAQAAIRAQKEK